MKSKIGVRLTAAVVLFVISFVSTSEAEQRDQVLLVLSSRHLVADPAQLEKLAGGADPLVKRLLKLRLDQSTPFVGVRAAKLLISYSTNPDVMSAIAEDIATEDREGLARVYAVHIDSAADDASRKAIAEQLIARGANSPSFRPFVRVLAECRDGEVVKLAKASLE